MKWCVLPYVFSPLLAGIPSFREEVCLASSQQRSFQRDGRTSLEFKCCQSPTVKTPRMDESAKIKQNTNSFSPSFFLTWMIYIYIHILERCSHLQPRLLFAPFAAFFFSSGCLWMTCSTPSSAISRQVVHFPPDTKVIPFVG